MEEGRARPIATSATTPGGSQRVPVSLGADPLLSASASRLPHSTSSPSVSIPNTASGKKPGPPSVSPISGASLLASNPASTQNPTEQFVNLKRKKIVTEAVENIDGLHCMMRVGAWKDSLKLAEKLFDIEKKPAEKLQYKLMVVVALTRLRDFRGALMEIEGLGNLHGPAYLFETYPQYYPDKKGSMVPFSLFVLNAELHQLADPTQYMKSFDLLYHLLGYCRNQIQLLGQQQGNTPLASPGRAGSPAVQSPRRGQKKLLKKKIGSKEDDDVSSSIELNGSIDRIPKGLEGLLDDGNGGSGDDLEGSESDSGLSVEDLESASLKFITPPSSPPFLRKAVQHSLYFDELNASQQVWRLREVRVMFTIASHLVRNHDLAAGIMVLQEIQEMYPRDPILLSCIGRIQLQLGNLEASEKLFTQAEDMLGNPASTIVLMNKGHFNMANDNFKGALRQFQKVLEHEPTNLAAVNNRAICWLYTCSLQRAISSLEEVILRDPENSLKEIIVFNLATLYDLGAEDGQDKKKKLLALIAKFASDDFDTSVLRMS